MKPIRHICIIDTVYALLLYLLYMSLDDIRSTVFFVGDVIDEGIRAKLPKTVPVPTTKYNWKTGVRCRFFRFFCWSGFYKADVYAQDHINFSDILIGRKNYVLLEDSPGIFSCLHHSVLKPSAPDKGDTIKRRVKYFLLHNKIYGKSFGTNSQCIKRLITDPKDVKSRYIQGTNYELVLLEDLWRTADEEKKKYVLNVFSVSEEDVPKTTDNTLLILTQPLVEDFHLDTNEVVAIFKPYVEQYESVVFKVHPRDHFDYKKYFPQAQFLDTKAPMQLLNLIGVSFPVALTVASSALSSMPKETKRIYLGTKINQKIYEACGDLSYE